MYAACIASYPSSTKREEYAEIAPLEGGGGCLTENFLGMTLTTYHKNFAISQFLHFSKTGQSIFLYFVMKLSKDGFDCIDLMVPSHHDD